MNADQRPKITAVASGYQVHPRQFHINKKPIEKTAIIVISRFGPSIARKWGRDSTHAIVREHLCIRSDFVSKAYFLPKSVTQNQAKIFDIHLSIPHLLFRMDSFPISQWG